MENNSNSAAIEGRLHFYGQLPFTAGGPSPLSPQEDLPECHSSGEAPTEHWNFSCSAVGCCTGSQCSLQSVWGRQETMSAQHGGIRAGGQVSYLRTTVAMQWGKRCLKIRVKNTSATLY